VCETGETLCEEVTGCFNDGELYVAAVCDGTYSDEPTPSPTPSPDINGDPVLLPTPSPTSSFPGCDSLDCLVDEGIMSSTFEVLFNSLYSPPHLYTYIQYIHKIPKQCLF
jgi:hypothetical protein